MRAPPASFDERRLRDHVNEMFRIDVARMEFVPKGDVGCSWIASLGAGDAVFVKLYDATKQDHLEKVARSTSVLRALLDGGVLDNVPRPMATLRGDFESRLDDWCVTLQTFIPGESFGGRTLTDDVARQIGQTAARLHASTRLASVLPVDHANEAGRTSLVDLLDSVRDALVHELPDAATHVHDVVQRVRELEAHVEQQPRSKLVPVHGDMGHDNVIVDPDGRVHIVDWDDARLSTPEVELAMTAWLAQPVFGSLAKAYTETLRDLDEPVPDLDVAAMELQVWRYNVGSIWFYLERLRRADLAAEQAASDRSLLAWTVSEWETTPAKFVAAAEALMASAR